MRRFGIGYMKKPLKEVEKQMRTGILHNGTGESNYEIRNIVFLAEKLEKLGVKIKLENIGDPIAKGEKIPVWMKDIVADIARDDNSYSYSPSKGILETRQYLAECSNRRGGCGHLSRRYYFFQWSW